MVTTRIRGHCSADSFKNTTSLALKEKRVQKRYHLKKKRIQSTTPIQIPARKMSSSLTCSGIERLCDDEWIGIIRHLLGGSMVVYLENPRASKMVSVLFMLNKSVRGTAHRVFYKYVQFTLGIELLISQPGESCRQQLRPEAIKFIEKLKIPGRLVHAFSRPECGAVSTALYFTSLKTLTVDFDAGDWDCRYAIYSKPKWTPEELIHRRVCMNFQSPRLFQWLKSKKDYNVIVTYRFPIDTNTYCLATIKDGKATYEDVKDTTPEQFKTLTLWKNSLDFLMKAK